MRLTFKKFDILMQIKGTLIPIGGNEDKGVGENEKYTLEFIDEGICIPCC